MVILVIIRILLTLQSCAGTAPSVTRCIGVAMRDATARCRAWHCHHIILPKTISILLLILHPLPLAPSYSLAQNLRALSHSFSTNQSRLLAASVPS